MAFFKTRKSGDEPAATPTQPDSIEVIRRRAKHRLIGSAALVLIGVIGFPILFDQQPRPVSLDIPIDVPERAKASTVAVPTAPAEPIIEEKEAPSPVLAASSASKNIAEAAPAKAVVSPIAPAPAPSPAPVAAPAPAPVAVVDEGAKAKALLEGREPPAPGQAASAPAAGRYVVQVGAYAEAARAQEVRGKLERAGLKTYTHVAESKEGRRIRVRVGPFVDKSEATKAAARIKQLDLPAAILTL